MVAGLMENPHVNKLYDERMRILHCRYKGAKDYAEKMSTAMTASDSVQKKKSCEFDKMLPGLD